MARKIVGPGENGMRQGIHILTAILLVVMVISALRTPLQYVGLTAVLAVLFAVAYTVGARRRDRMTPLKAQLWLLILTLLWVILIPINTTAVYLVFPLFFLYLQVMPDFRGIIAVIAATLISIISQFPSGLTAGGILGPSVAALVSIGIDYAFRALWTVSQERQKLIEELLETRSQLAETERAAGIAAERQRIAHEIHDTLAQGLSSIQMLLYVAEQDLAKLDIMEAATEAPLKRIRLAKSTAADNLSEARAMIAALQPAALSKTSLEGALQRVANGINDTEVDIVVDGDERQLPMRTEASLLRIAQGALGNVAKHAQAQHCRVTLTYGDEEIRLDIVDDGIGFSPADVAQRPAGLGHIGLDAMRQRAAEQGGHVNVESTPGGGTAVIVVLPVDAPLDSLG